MNRLYAVALVVTGILFVVMSIPSVRETSGQFALGAAIVCLILAVVLWLRNTESVPVEETVPEAHSTGRDI